MSIDGASRDRIKPLNFTRRAEVEFLDIEEEESNRNQNNNKIGKRNQQNHNNTQSVENGAKPHTDDIGQHFIDSVNILGETIHDSSQWSSIKERHWRMTNIVQHPHMQILRRSQATIQKRDSTDQNTERGNDRQSRVNTQIITRAIGGSFIGSDSSPLSKPQLSSNLSTLLQTERKENHKRIEHSQRLEVLPVNGPGHLSSLTSLRSDELGALICSFESRFTSLPLLLFISILLLIAINLWELFPESSTLCFFLSLEGWALRFFLLSTVTSRLIVISTNKRAIGKGQRGGSTPLSLLHRRRGGRVGFFQRFLLFFFFFLQCSESISESVSLVNQLLISSRHGNHSLVHHKDGVTLRKVLLSMGHKNTNFLGKKTSRANNIIKNMSSDMSIDSTEGVIKEINISVLVHGTSKRNTLLLPSTKSDTFLTNLCEITSRKHGNILLQTTGVNHTKIFLHDKWLAENNIVS
mmetsp:Transcript_12992/g.19989  ORF Transcript_12992/g.19989 Transcript_12992/m.19989 type:complete len:466 (-) Transcript_12992:1914-3311(-)